LDSDLDLDLDSDSNSDFRSRLRDSSNTATVQGKTSSGKMILTINEKVWHADPTRPPRRSRKRQPRESL